MPDRPRDWLAHRRHAFGLDRLFPRHRKIMIATEAEPRHQPSVLLDGSHYDLPWNPQRIEQRSAVVSYGQKHDVVWSFSQSRDAADQRVYQLLSKIPAFRRRVRCSDEVLGAIENGVDSEKRIAEIYQQCRNP